MSYSPLFRGRVATGSIASVDSTFLNLSGGILLAYTIISIDASGNAQKTNVSSETLSMSTIGVLKLGVLNGQVGTATTYGRIQNASTSFALGDTLYLDKVAGALTNVKPSVGINGFAAGDWIVHIGTVLKNESNPLNKDLYINPTIVGQL